MSNEIELTHDGLRQLAAALLDAIPNGDAHENMMMLATFNTNLLAGLIFGGAANKETAHEALDAYMGDVRKFIDNNFEIAKQASEELKAQQENDGR